MSGVLVQWNRLPVDEAVKEILPCCSSKAWAAGMAARRPFSDVTTLLAASEETWSNLSAADWMEAFRGHPRIGESLATPSGSDQSATWSAQEQKNRDEIARKIAAASLMWIPFAAEISLRSVKDRSGSRQSQRGNDRRRLLDKSVCIG